MRSETGPLLNLEIDGADVDVTGDMNVQPKPRAIDKVASCRRVGEAAGLRSETAKAEHQLRISIDFFVAKDIAWTRHIGVLADVGWRPDVVVNLSFDSVVIQEVEVTPESEAFDIALGIVRIGEHSAYAGLY